MAESAEDLHKSQHKRHSIAHNRYERWYKKYENQLECQVDNRPGIRTLYSRRYASCKKNEESKAMIRNGCIMYTYYCIVKRMCIAQTPIMKKAPRQRRTAPIAFCTALIVFHLLPTIASSKESTSSNRLNKCSTCLAFYVHRADAYILVPA